MKRVYASRELIRIIEADGWYRVNQAGSHLQFKHATKPGRITIVHPRHDVPIGTARSIFRQAGIEPDVRRTAGIAGTERVGNMHRYIALIRKIPESDFGVELPDFPGCVTAGRTLDQALARAPEALALHAAGMIEDGEPLPAPRSLEEIMAEPDHRDAVAAVVELAAMRPEIERVNLTIDKRLREAIDARAAEEGMTRSGWIAAIARRAIAAVEAPRDLPVRSDASAGTRRDRHRNARSPAKKRA